MGAKESSTGVLNARVHVGDADVDDRTERTATRLERSVSDIAKGGRLESRGDAGEGRTAQ